MQKNILETRELSKVYREQKAVNAVSIQVRENTVYGLLGANGAGKSTLLKMIAGIVRPTQGSILVTGTDWKETCREIFYGNEAETWACDRSFKSSETFDPR